MTAAPRLTATLDIFHTQVIPERWRQIKQHGMESLPDGTGRHYVIPRDRQQTHVALMEARGRATWADLLLEEVFEALAESDDGPLEAELTQVVALGFAWLEDIQRRRRLTAEAA